MKTIHTSIEQRFRAAKFAAMIAVVALLGFLATYSHADPAGTPTTTQVKFDPQTGQKIINVNEAPALNPIHPATVNKSQPEMPFFDQVAADQMRDRLINVFKERVKNSKLDDLLAIATENTEMAWIIESELAVRIKGAQTSELANAFIQTPVVKIRLSIANEIVQREKTDTSILFMVFTGLGKYAPGVPNLEQVIMARSDLTDKQLASMIASLPTGKG